MSAQDKNASVQIDFSVLAGQVDVSNGLACWGDSLVYAKALKCFARQHHDDVSLIDAKMQLGKSDEALLLAHSLKGVAANLSMHKVARAAGPIEAVINMGGSKESIADLSRPLQTVLCSAIKAIEALEIPLEDTPAQALKDFSVEELSARLSHISTILDDCNPDPVISSLQEIKGHISEADFDSIESHTDLFDFDEAKIAVDALRAKLFSQD